MTSSEQVREEIARVLGKDRLHELDKPVFGGRQLSDKQIEEIADALMERWPVLAEVTDEPVTDAEVEAGARALNRNGWTCDSGGDEPGRYDECEYCRRACAGPARTVLLAARGVRAQ